MASRLDLQTHLEAILGTRNVYFQPPESIKLKYPCIIYELSRIDTTKANNNSYIKNVSYDITLIDEDPDSEYVNKLLNIQHCRFDRSFQTSGLNHFTFTIYY